ncbi:MAG: SMP-30/gluconolactonase/LRE family protein, partial [Sphingopyxis sp.]
MTQPDSSPAPALSTPAPAAPDHLAQTLSATPACIIHAGNMLGEGPRWHAQEGRLYWVDIAQQQLHRWHSQTGAHDVRMFDAPIACFAFRAAGGLVLGMKDGCALMDDWADTPRPFGEQMLAGRPHHRMNDGRTDPSGRFWLGSQNGAKDVADATLYRLDGDGAVHIIEGGMMTCNGAAFNADGTRFHHANTPSHAVRAYDVDATTGTLSRQRILHQFAVGVGPGLGR